MVSSYTRKALSTSKNKSPTPPEGRPKRKRSKSGCITCRVRGKLCDQNRTISPDGNESCDICKRLRICCLGFDDKRPSWLKDKNNMAIFKAKIKDFLFSQGLIKGQAGCGVRPTESSPRYLTLSEILEEIDTRDYIPTSSVHSYPPSGMGTDFGCEDNAMSYSPDSTSSPDSALTDEWSNCPHVGAVVPSLRSTDFTFQQQQTLGYEEHEPIMSSVYPETSPLFSPPLFLQPLVERGIFSNELVHHYMQSVLKVQYRLANHHGLGSLMLDLAFSSEAAAHSLCLLAAVHQHSMRQIGRGDSTERRNPLLDDYYTRAKQALSLARPNGYSEGDAMAGLHLISAWLFIGGRGPWDTFLRVACDWVESTISKNKYNAVLALLNSTSRGRFIFRTTFWMDVLASVTLGRTPRLISVYRQLFTPGCNLPPWPEFAMEEVMGASNTTLLAIAEVAALAHWKEQQEQGTLSYVDLVAKGMAIEHRYLGAPQIEPYMDETSIDSDTRLRRNVSEVFRHSTRCYLHSVLSGCHPRVKQIQEAVAATIASLEAMGQSTATDRSIVFCITICGVMTDQQRQKDFLVDRLKTVGRDAEVFGNCKQAKELIEAVWIKRTKGEVPCWRTTMKELNQETLLLV